MTGRGVREMETAIGEAWRGTLAKMAFKSATIMELSLATREYSRTSACSKESTSST
eukprot:CAMPEP_0168608294 /NCGR_PEP_ID=MMETSP0449_2-20121227/545_1 /TAXON_ID=1082188 /ORGANISM="Strombidium rassoulzadegani, Strain ras09" /LENGTH=55 /DNA_ID=CAMNT_0008648259 /DNA_START=271 /DNA_END=438 /DNA_ORIENTATION=+